jgi:hypothetical protein
MKLLPHNLGKWAVPVIIVAIIVVLATPFDQGGAKTVSTVSTAGRIEAAASVPASTAPRAPEPGGVEMDRLTRTQPESDVAAEIGNVFDVTSWYVPPPPPPPQPVLPPPPPSAPPLPFTYLGRYEDAPKHLTILVKGERIYTVAEGDVIDDTYRVERIVPGMVELTYLPLNIKQMLSTGEAL